MKIAIAERLKPFSHTPGVACLIPGTCWKVEAFPTLLRIGEKYDLPLPITGPVADFTLELDLEKVRRVRERGFKGLAQTLKSFRDRSVAFPLYQPGGFDLSYLNALGPLHVPARAPAQPAAASEAVISNIQAVKFG